MNNPHRAKLFILQNCDWIDEIVHNPNALAPCQRWIAYNSTHRKGEKIQVREWTDGDIVTFARKLKKQK